MIAFLAISLVGGRCLQLDKAFPGSLLQDVIDETGAEVLLCDCDFNIGRDVKTINIVDVCRQNISSVKELLSIAVDPDSPYG